MAKQIGCYDEKCRNIMVENAESNVTSLETKPTRRQRFARHCLRYWIYYLIAKLVLLAVLLPVSFLIIFPAIGQMIVNQQELILHDASLLQPAPDEMTFSLRSSLTVPKPFVVGLDPLNLSLFIRNSEPHSPYTFLEVPKQKLHGNATIIVEPQRARIVNASQWFTFLNASLYDENLTLSAKGTTMAHFGALKAKLTIDKDIKIKGLNQLKGFSVTSAQLLVPSTPDGPNLGATLNLPNYSPVTFDLGNQSFNLKLQDLQIGVATIYDLTLTPGSNIRQLYGTLDFEQILSNFESVLRTSAPALSAGNLELWTTGRSTVYNGQHIPYYETLLGGLVLSANISITDVLVGSLGVALNGSAADIQNIASIISPALKSRGRRFRSIKRMWPDVEPMNVVKREETTCTQCKMNEDNSLWDLGRSFLWISDAISMAADGVAMASQILQEMKIASKNESTRIIDVVRAVGQQYSETMAGTEAPSM